MERRLRILVYTLMIFLFSLTFPVTHAQIVPGLQNTLTLTVTPTYPKANESVFVKVESFSIDLNRAGISWFINGALEQAREGGTNFQFTAPPIGKAATIDVTAEIPNGVTEQTRVTIRPADAQLIWQAHTYAPSFYAGKKFPAVGSDISIEAVPNFIAENGRQLSASDLIYTWYVNGTIAQSLSGKGRSSATVSQTKPVQTLPVEVLVESADQLLSHKTRILIPMKNPEVLVYENNPLLGMLFNTTIKNTYRLAAEETKFTAFSFFMSLSGRNDAHISYLWKLDGTAIALGDDRSSITVNHSGDGSGVAKIDASVENTRDIFQKGSATFFVEFGEERSLLFNL